jgi:tetratricopeptide (TPR) repeat protein
VLRPLVDYFLDIANAPVWAGAAAIVAVTLWLVHEFISRLRTGPSKAGASVLEPLTAEQAGLVERALAANAQRIAPEPDAAQPAGADARSMVRAALINYVKSGDPRARRVAAHLADGRTQEARDLAAAIASEGKAARAWIDASAVAYLNDAKAAIAASERARDLGARDVVVNAWLGRLYLSRGRLAEAEAAFRAAETALGPREKASRAALLGNLGDVALKRGDLPAARVLLEQALALYSDMGAGGQELARRARDNLAKLDGR